MFDDDDFVVVVNDEEQYSLWNAHRGLPDGWRATGPARSREACLAQIEQVWTDLRPKSLREASGQQPPR